MNFFKNFRFAQKISVLTISFFVFLTIIGIASIKQISNVHSKVMELNDSRLVPIVKLEDIKSDIEYIRSQANSIMDARGNDTKKKAIQKDIETHAASVDNRLTEYKSNTRYSTMIKYVNAFLAAKDSFIKSQGAGTKQTMGMTASGPTTGGPPQDIKQLDNTRKEAINTLDKIIDQHIANAQNTYSDSKDVYKTTLMIIISLLIISAVVTLILSIVITKSIVVPVRNVTAKLKEISQSNGDLTQRIDYTSNDEIGELSSSFNLFVEKLLNIIKEVAHSAETISSSSEHLIEATGATVYSLDNISKTVAEIAAGSSQGAAFAEETTANLTEAANFSEATSKATKHTTDNTKKVKEAAEEGAGKISEIISSITEIASSSKDVSFIINELNDSSVRIGEIIQIITGISAQTNLLALNAAIEAARAGEAGRGFSVVADEIRKLADQSNTAALEISNLVKENQTQSSTAVSSVNLVEEKVMDGVNIASEVGKSIHNIIEHIQSTVSEVEQIDLANEKQAQYSKEMEQAIANLTLTSNEIAGGTENISASIEEQLSTMTGIEHTIGQLSDMAKKLRDLTGGFKIEA
ncbi:MAG: methyl-accepting chemotaxis protein [Bacillota bacterium]|nr:methyl-accepting chemotaxis protein [Bacillota bacterium]